VGNLIHKRKSSLTISPFKNWRMKLLFFIRIVRYSNLKFPFGVNSYLRSSLHTGLNRLKIRRLSLKFRFYRLPRLFLAANLCSSHRDLDIQKNQIWNPLPYIFVILVKKKFFLLCESGGENPKIMGSTFTPVLQAHCQLPLLEDNS